VSVLVDPVTLVSLTSDCFERLGVPLEDANAVAEVLVDSNLHGTSSHGFQRVPIYMRRVRSGLACGTEATSVVSEFGGLCQMNAGHALGPAAAVKALDRAVDLARQCGVGCVALGGSTHFGSAGYYARRACRAGMVSIVMTNAAKRMAPVGAAKAFIGTNAVAIGVPMKDHDPFVLDMASSVEAQGKITRAKQLGQEIPVGIALDSAGRPTTDPASALEGSLLPMGGAKGSGLALAITMLVVLLADAECDDLVASLYKDFDRPQDLGHVFIVIDPSRIGGEDRIHRLDDMIERLLALEPAEVSSEVRYPGQARASLARQRSRDGVPIEPEELRNAAETCLEFGFSDLAGQFMSLLKDSSSSKGSTG
jgi:LDH2 family malate/lactate/ureidoglycolate dehydrogenase